MEKRYSINLFIFVISLLKREELGLIFQDLKEIAKRVPEDEMQEFSCVQAVLNGRLPSALEIAEDDLIYMIKSLLETETILNHIRNLKGIGKNDRNNI